MKSIVSVNTELPSIEDYIEYYSGESLLDYDIILFDPKFPYASRIEFSGGGSCINIEDSKELSDAMEHWTKELLVALKAGKTVFYILNDLEMDDIATGSTLTNKNQRTYHTQKINNYSVLPVEINVRNAKGKQFVVNDNRFKSLKTLLDKVAQYRVVLTSEVEQKIFLTKNKESVVGALVKIKDCKGHLILLPYFNLTEIEEMFDEDEEVWTKEGKQISIKIGNQLAEIDRVLRLEDNLTPAPVWIDDMKQPDIILESDKNIETITNKIIALENRKQKQIDNKNQLLQYSHLLYENGKALEVAIERSLELLGYKVENFKTGDLEIDHLIVSPQGKRLVGEAEGKDNSAIDISKFRQLESHINEDFERDDVSEPAKGLLFGNGFRFIEPNKREEQFTKKCLINAKRLRVALIRTMDLYNVVVHILNNPNDKVFKEKCRKAIENTEGEIVVFPK